MSGITARSESESRWYRPRVRSFWWLRRWPYFRFMLREFSSIFVGFWVVITLLQIRALTRGPQAYAAFESWLRSPVLIALNLLSFLFVLFHVITWFNATPQAVVARVRGERVPGAVLVGANYVAWLVVSAVVAWFLLRG